MINIPFSWADFDIRGQSLPWIKNNILSIVKSNWVNYNLEQATYRKTYRGGKFEYFCQTNQNSCWTPMTNNISKVLQYHIILNAKHEERPLYQWCSAYTIKSFSKKSKDYFILNIHESNRPCRSKLLTLTSALNLIQTAPLPLLDYGYLLSIVDSYRDVLGGRHTNFSASCQSISCLRSTSLDHTA